MAVVFATKEVVLDYVMGFLLLVEGPFFKGDYVVVRDHAGAEGVVEEIGLRRTLLRDALGSSHAVSNGLVRLSSNLTRMFSVAVVELHVLHAAELDRALATVAQVAARCAGDAAWADRFLADAPTDIWVTGIGTDGASIRLQQRVPAGIPDARRERAPPAAGRRTGPRIDRHGAVGHAAADRRPALRLVAGGIVRAGRSPRTLPTVVSPVMRVAASLGSSGLERRRVARHEPG